MPASATPATVTIGLKVRFVMTFSTLLDNFDDVPSLVDLLRGLGYVQSCVDAGCHVGGNHRRFHCVACGRPECFAPHRIFQVTGNSAERCAEGRVLDGVL